MMGSKRINAFFGLRLGIWGLLTAAGFLGVIGSLSGFFGRYAWWMDLGSHFRIQYVVLFAVLSACYFVGKKNRWAIACLFMAVVNVAPVLAFIVPRIAYDAGDSPMLRAVLINVNTQYGNPQSVIQLLQQENPDIIILEEINEAWIRDLSDTLSSYEVQRIETRDDNFGIALFARVPTRSTEVVYFGSAGVPSIVATMRMDGRSFKLLATHPLPPGGAEYSNYRNEQLRNLAAYARTSAQPLILFGDLNVSPWSPHYRDFIRESGLVNSSKGRAIHPTWPTFFPLFLIQIDHCLHTDGIAIRAKKVASSTGSDHFPVIVDFAIKDRPTAARRKSGGTGRDSIYSRNAITPSSVGASAKSITSRSKPSATPPLGGICERADRNASSSGYTFLLSARR